MPLARIFTRNPERTTDLSSQLKQQGYSVEVTRPDQANLAPADLEIEFEICERSDVLDRAADLASELGADVAVAPGILQMSAKPVAEPILAAPVASEPIVSQKIISHKIVAEPETQKVMHLESNVTVEHDPERDFEAAFAPVIEMPAAAVQASQEVIDVLVMEQDPMPPVAFLEESPIVQPIAAVPMADHYREAPVAQTVERYPEVPVAFSEPARPADPMPYLAQLTPFSGRASRTPELSMEERQQNAVPSVRPQDPPQVQARGKQVGSKKVLQDGARVAAHTWAGALALAASTKASVRDHFEEYRKRAQVRSAEARAEHAARLLDLEQRRAMLSVEVEAVRTLEKSFAESDAALVKEIAATKPAWGDSVFDSMLPPGDGWIGACVERANGRLRARPLHQPAPLRRRQCGRGAREGCHRDVYRPSRATRTRRHDGGVGDQGEGNGRAAETYARRPGEIAAEDRYRVAAEGVSEKRMQSHRIAPGTR